MIKVYFWCCIFALVIVHLIGFFLVWGRENFCFWILVLGWSSLGFYSCSWEFRLISFLSNRTESAKYKTLSMKLSTRSSLASNLKINFAGLNMGTEFWPRIFANRWHKNNNMSLPWHRMHAHVKSHAHPKLLLTTKGAQLQRWLPLRRPAGERRGSCGRRGSRGGAKLRSPEPRCQVSPTVQRGQGPWPLQGRFSSMQRNWRWG